MRRSPSCRLSLACAVVGILAGGCGPTGPKLYSVRGTVTVDGQPGGHAIVFLHRKDRTDPNEPVPYGRAGEDGRFVVTSRTDGDGALPGEYVLTVVWPDPNAPAGKDGERPDRLAGKYEKLAGSTLSAVVKAEPNDWPPVELVSAPK